jgi:hypothetical protein
MIIRNILHFADPSAALSLDQSYIGNNQPFRISITYGTFEFCVIYNYFVGDIRIGNDVIS